MQSGIYCLLHHYAIHFKVHVQHKQNLGDKKITLNGNTFVIGFSILSVHTQTHSGLLYFNSYISVD